MDKETETVIASERIAKAAVDAAKITADAVQVAKDVVSNAALRAAELVKDNNIQTTKTLSDALREVFGEHEESQRFIDTKRIPLICKDISNMNVRLEKIDDNIKWIVRLIIGAVVLALLGLVLMHK